MSRLRIRGEWLFNERMVKVTVLEREATRSKFGGNTTKVGASSLFFGTKCCLVGSSEFRDEGINPDDNLHDIKVGPVGSTVKFKLEVYEKLKEAVKEYNEWRDSLSVLPKNSTA